MSGLGLFATGAAAAQRRLLDESRAIDRHRWQTAKEEAELSVLPDKTAAQRQGYALALAQSRAGLDTLPLETEKKQLGLQSALADNRHEEAMRPMREATDANRNALAQQQSAFELKNFVVQQKTALMKGVIDMNTYRMKMASALADLAEAGDGEGMVHLINDSADLTDFGIQMKVPATSVDVVESRTEGQIIVARGAKGEVVFQMPMAQLRAIRQQFGGNPVKEAKPEYKTLKPGESLVRADPKTGKVALMYEARGLEKPVNVSPVLRDQKMYEAIGYAPPVAQEMARTNKSPNRQSFLLNYLKENRYSGVSEDELLQRANAIYDKTYPVQASGIRGQGSGGQGSGVQGSGIRGQGSENVSAPAASKVKENPDLFSDLKLNHDKKRFGDDLNLLLDLNQPALPIDYRQPDPLDDPDERRE